MAVKAFTQNGEGVLVQQPVYYTQNGEGVLVQQPVYYPFSEVIEDNERKLINSPLILKSGHYEIDFADLEEKIVANNVKLMLLCSPHNPVGRVWTRAEL